MTGTRPVYTVPGRGASAGRLIWPAACCNWNGRSRPWASRYRQSCWMGSGCSPYPNPARIERRAAKVSLIAHVRRTIAPIE